MKLAQSIDWQNFDEKFGVSEAGAQELLRETIQAGLQLQVIKPSQLKRVKVSLGVTSKGGWIVAAKSCPGNPYNGHTLQSKMDQLLSITGREPEHVYADMGYRGHGYEGECEVHVDSRRRGDVAISVWRWIKRRAAIEPTIGHLKEDRRMERNGLGGTEGDKLNAVLSAAGMNFSKLLSALGALLSSLLVRVVAAFTPRRPSRALAASVV